jgi:uncharacterized membrane protein
MMRLLIWIASGCIGALIVHLSAVLLLPNVTGNTVAARSLARLPINTLSLETDGSSPIIRFADPTALYAYCPFELGTSPLRIVSAVSDIPMSFVFVAPNGTIFSAFTDRAANRGVIDLRLGTAEQIDALADLDDPANPPTEYRVASPHVSGTVVIKAFMATPSMREAARDALNTTRCGLG